MKIWAVANQKGGVGKTTSAVNLAGVMHNRGQRVLLIDLDPHGSLTTYFGYDPDDVNPSGFDLFKQTHSVRQVIRRTDFSYIDFIAASSGLATLDRQLGTRDGMGLVIGKALEALSMDYDYAIMDCPPMLGLLMVNALAACHHLLIPVQTEFLAIKGLERMLHTLGMIQKARRTALQYSIVPTLYDQRVRASHEALESLRHDYAGHMWEYVIPVDTQLREASKHGAPLTVERPGSRAARAYAALFDYLLAVTSNEMTQDTVRQSVV